MFAKRTLTYATNWPNLHTTNLFVKREFHDLAIKAPVNSKAPVRTVISRILCLQNKDHQEYHHHGVSGHKCIVLQLLCLIIFNYHSLK